MIKTIKEHWTEPYGDRRQELVFIGTEIDKALIKTKLEACLLSDDEYEKGPDAWQYYTDPIHPWEAVEEEEEVLVG